tara:strand:- start:1356 stop:2522 length:1167 start_codon:yes stop_codon:yes gene_type:complete
MNIQQRKILCLSCLLVIFAPLGIDLYLPALPEINRVYQQNSGFVLTLYFLGLALGQLGSGLLADKYGRKLTIQTNLFIFGLSALLIGYTLNFEQLLFLRVVQGLAAGGLISGWMMLIQDYFPKAQVAQRYSLLHAVLNTMPVIGPLLGSYFISLGSWHIGSYTLCAMAWLALLVFQRVYQEAASLSKDIFDMQLCRQILSHPHFLRYGLSCCTAHAFVLSYVTLAPRIIIEQGHASHMTFSTYFSVNAMVVMCLCYAVPWLIHKFGQAQVFYAGLSLMWIGGLLLIGISSFNQPLYFMLAIHVACLGFGLFLAPAKSYTLMPFTRCIGACTAFLGFLDLAFSFLISSMMSYFDVGAFGLGLFLILTMSLCFYLVWALSHKQMLSIPSR